MLTRLVLFAFLSIGCSLESKDLDVSALGDIRTDSVRCGWIAAETEMLEDLEAGKCWMLQPETADRTTSLANVQACDVVSYDFEIYRGSSEIQIWYWFGTQGHPGVIKTSIVDC